MQKKILSLVVSLLFCFCMAFSVSAATDTLKISLGEPEILENGVFEINVNIDENPGIISLRLEIQYDKSDLTLLDIKDCDKLGEDYHSDNLSADKLYLYWNNPLNKEDIKARGTVAVLKFANTDNDADVSSVSLFCNEDNFDALNYNLQTVKTSFSEVKPPVSEPETEDKTSSEETAKDNTVNHIPDTEEPEIEKDLFFEEIPAAVYVSLSIGVLIIVAALILRRSKK